MTLREEKVNRGKPYSDYITKTIQSVVLSKVAKVKKVCLTIIINIDVFAVNWSATIKCQFHVDAESIVSLIVHFTYKNKSNS